MMKRRLLPGLIGAATAGAIGLAIAAWPAAGQAGAHQGSATRDASAMAPPTTCGVPAETIGYLGVLRAGQAAVARQALGSRLLAQVSDPAQHTTADLIRTTPGLGAPGGTEYFSRWLPVYPQARQRQLRSCNQTLSDRPADQPLVSAAVTAFVRARYFRSAADARAQRQMVLVSDDPAAAGSVIVTFLITGPVYNPPVPPGSKAGPHPPLHLLDAYTAIVTLARAAVTGVARGGF